MQVVVSLRSIMCTKELGESKWATIFLWRRNKEKRGHELAYFQIVLKDTKASSFLPLNYTIKKWYQIGTGAFPLGAN